MTGRYQTLSQQVRDLKVEIESKNKVIHDLELKLKENREIVRELQSREAHNLLNAWYQPKCTL